MADVRSEKGPRGAPATWSLLLSVVGAAVSALGAPSCLEQRSGLVEDREARRCASCHGDAERAGDFLLRSAPPSDLLGRVSPHDPGVGAHAVHLQSGPAHAAVSCQECHVVPDTTDAPGHADDARPAEVTFGALARHGEREPRYDFSLRSCSDSYCHGQARPRWTEPRSSQEACGSCHGLPPPLPHPQMERCSACHGDVIDEHGRFLAPERHVDGTVDYRAGECRSCHGSETNAAPPGDVSGETTWQALGVGAHQLHLNGGSGRTLACGECHALPERVEEATHVDGLPAEVSLVGVAASGGREPKWDRASATCSDSWCHSPSAGDRKAAAVWNGTRDLGCQGCHGTPPPAPHPQMEDCSRCHGDVVADDDRTIVDRLLHVDGHVDVELDQGCGSCHGSADAPAPPRDVSGNVEASAAGVGAHQTHVLGTPRSAKVACETCHVVPDTARAAGHIDSALPAEVVFSGAALAFGAVPSYGGGSCRDTSCHGAVLPRGHASGGSNNEPLWTVVDGTQAACGTCHGLPPPPPHPLDTFPCHSCHFNVATDDASFVRPDLHVDGIVTFTLP